MLRTSETFTPTLTSASSVVVDGLPASTLSTKAPVEFAAAPFASGVPTVRKSEVGTGGPQEPNESGAPCVLFGAAQGLKAGTSEARKGEAPLART